MRLSPSPRLIGVVVVALVALGLIVDAVAIPDSEGAAELEPAGPATSGASFCAAGRTSGGNRLRVVTAVPPSPEGGRANTTVSVVHGGRSQAVAQRRVAAGTAAGRMLPRGLKAPGVTTRWWERPAATTRFWRARQAGSAPALVAGPCQPGGSGRWIIPGLATAGGATSQIVLSNPYDTDASVQIAIATPEGLREPRLLENIAVPARSSHTVPVNEHAPAQADLGVIVTTRAGRVVVEGVQHLDAAIGGIEGASLLSAAPAGALRWTLPWYRSDPDRAEGWLWVTNPSQEPAVVTLRIHTGEGAVVPEAAGETTVDPGEVRRVDLRNLVDASSKGVTVTSDNGVPVVVSGATRVDAGSEARSGVAVQLGAPVTDTSWSVTAPAEGDRRVHLQVANPTSQQATVDVALWDGSRTRRPGPLRGVTVPAGGVVRLDLQRFVSDVPFVTAFVAASSGEVVAGVESFTGSGRYDLVGYVGVPSAVSRGTPAPPVRFDPGMTERLGPGGAMTTTPGAGGTPGELPGESDTAAPLEPAPEATGSTPD